jgi:hypothetical protein
MLLTANKKGRSITSNGTPLSFLLILWLIQLQLQ